MANSCNVISFFRLESPFVPNQVLRAVFCLHNCLTIIVCVPTWSVKKFVVKCRLKNDPNFFYFGAKVHQKTICFSFMAVRLAYADSLYCHWNSTGPDGSHMWRQYSHLSCSSGSSFICLKCKLGSFFASAMYRVSEISVLTWTWQVW